MAEDIAKFLIQYVVEKEIYVVRYDGESTYFTSKVEAHKYLLLLIDRDFSFMKNIYNIDDALNIKLDKIKQKLIELRNSNFIKMKPGMKYSIEYNDDLFAYSEHYTEPDGIIESNLMNMASISTIKIHHNLSSVLESTNFHKENSISNPKKRPFSL